MKIISIGGIPGTGKSSLLKSVIQKIDDLKVFSPIKLVEGLYSEKYNLFIVGKYYPFHLKQEEIFEGTDKLAMNVQPNFIQFLKETNMNVLFEGDRLFTNSLFSAITDNQKVQDFSILILEANREILHQRYQQRGSDQNEKFISSRKTKIENISCNFDLMDKIQFVRNETKEDSIKNTSTVLNFFNIPL